MSNPGFWDRSKRFWTDEHFADAPEICRRVQRSTERTGGDGTYVRDDFLKAHPDIVQDLVSVQVKAIDLILKDPDRAIDIWTKENNFPRAVIEYAVKQKISVFDRNMVPDRATLDAYTAFLKKAGLLSDTDNAKVETKFAEQALKEVK